MKTSFIILLLTFIYTSHAQDCKVEQNPIPPVLGMEVKASVNHKDKISFYTIEGVTDSLIVLFRFMDFWGRTVQVGDSAVVKLKNGHSFKLYSLRESISTFKTPAIALGEKIWYYTFVAYISKNDVRKLSEIPTKRCFLYSKIDEIYHQDRYDYITLKARNKQRDKAEFGSGKLNAWNRNLRQLANCALEL